MSKAKELTKDDKKLKEAITMLLDAGCEIYLKKKLLYTSNSGDYTILTFDQNSRLVMEQEENFADINDAVSKFVQRTFNQGKS